MTLDATRRGDVASNRNGPIFDATVASLHRCQPIRSKHVTSAVSRGLCTFVKNGGLELAGVYYSCFRKLA